LETKITPYSGAGAKKALEDLPKQMNGAFNYNVTATFCDNKENEQQVSAPKTGGQLWLHKTGLGLAVGEEAMIGHVKS